MFLPSKLIDAYHQKYFYHQKCFYHQKLIDEWWDRLAWLKRYTMYTCIETSYGILLLHIMFTFYAPTKTKLEMSENVSVMYLA
jgi:hypothetical protein